MNRHKLLFILFIMFCGSSTGQDPDSLKYRSLDPYYFHLEWLRNDPAVLIDVRLFAEYRGRRIKDAINMPSSKHLLSFTDTLSRDYHIFLYCSDDFRSRRAAEMLYERGFRNLYSLEGGIVAWRKENMPVDRTKVKRRR